MIYLKHSKREIQKNLNKRKEENIMINFIENVSDELLEEILENDYKLSLERSGNTYFLSYYDYDNQVCYVDLSILDLADWMDICDIAYRILENTYQEDDLMVYSGMNEYRYIHDSENLEEEILIQDCDISTIYSELEVPLAEALNNKEIRALDYLSGNSYHSIEVSYLTQEDMYIVI